MLENIQNYINKIDFQRFLYSGFQIIVIIVFSIIMTKITSYLLKKFSKNDKLFTPAKRKTLKTVIGATLKSIIWFMAICSILPYFNIKVESLLTVAGVGSLAIGFAAQGLVRDFFTGIFILLEDQYNIGDLITINNTTGVVENLTMRVTKIRANDGSLHIIPNGQITMVTSLSKEFTRAIVDIGIPYDSDLDLVFELIKDETDKLSKKLDNLLSVPEILGITEFKDNYINIRITANCKPSTHFQIEREIRLILYKRLEKENIGAPIKIMKIYGGNNGF